MKYINQYILFVSLFAIGLVGVSLGLTFFSASSPQSVYTDSVDSVVTLYNDGEFTDSQGSGFVIEDGFIVSNEHTVSESEELYVEYADGTVERAFVVSTDEYTDISVLSVPDGHPSETEPLSFSSDYRVGDEVVVIGSPSGFNKSLTTGTVSGVDRNVDTGVGNYSIPRMVQIDAALNPGNSGGPILNMDGDVIGVSQSTLGENLGFGVSAELAEFIVESLTEDGQHNHPLVGVETIDITPLVASDIDREPFEGVIVTGVMEDEPADSVLKPAEISDDGKIEETGDVITHVDDQPISSNADLSRVLLSEYEAGDTVVFKISRDGSLEEVTIELSERP